MKEIHYFLYAKMIFSTDQLKLYKNFSVSLYFGEKWKTCILEKQYLRFFYLFNFFLTYLILWDWKKYHISKLTFL
jgi:hypothetical protein